MAVFFQQSGWK